MHKPRLLPFLCLLTFLAVPRAHAQQDIQYGPDPTQMITLCAPDGGGTARPAALLIHGGGWRAGNRQALGPVCALFAAHGIVAAAVDYRLNIDPPRTAWPIQFSDVQLALRFLRAHAAAWRIDPNHICAEGDSAGGQLALLLGAVPTIDPGDMQRVLSTISPHANCVAALSGPSDLLELAKFHGGAVRALLSAPTPADFRPRAISGSPALRLQRGVPTLLIHGLSDEAVPFAQAQEMQSATAAAGAPAWLVTHPGGHEADGLTPDQKHLLWPFIAAFIRAERLPLLPGQLPIEQAMASFTVGGFAAHRNE
jgi:acetyl esterase/lipase